MRPGIFTRTQAGPVGDPRPAHRLSPRGPRSPFTKRNRFCSRSGSRRHRPTGTHRAGLERDARPGPGMKRETKRTRGNSTVIFVGAKRPFCIFCAGINGPEDVEVKPSPVASADETIAEILLSYLARKKRENGNNLTMSVATPICLAIVRPSSGSRRNALSR